MKICIDFDDVLCETAKYFTKIAKELFGIDVPYREVAVFDRPWNRQAELPNENFVRCKNWKEIENLLT